MLVVLQLLQPLLLLHFCWPSEQHGGKLSAGLLHSRMRLLVLGYMWTSRSLLSSLSSCRKCWGLMGLRSRKQGVWLITLLQAAVKKIVGMLAGVLSTRTAAMLVTGLQ